MLTFGWMYGIESTIFSSLFTAFSCPFHRYDARLLLESLPDVSSPSDNVARPSSPGGWSDLPSDSEDTFFFSAEEVEDYRREKRRRVMNRDREARLRAIRAEEGDDEAERDPKEDWGGSDEEVRFATHVSFLRPPTLILSPSPAQTLRPPTSSLTTQSASSCGAQPCTSSHRQILRSSRCASSQTMERTRASHSYAGDGRACGG